MFRPEMLEPMGFPKDVHVHGWGIGLERPTMIRYVDCHLLSRHPLFTLVNISLIVLLTNVSFISLYLASRAGHYFTFTTLLCAWQLNCGIGKLQWVLIRQIWDQ